MPDAQIYVQDYNTRSEKYRQHSSIIRRHVPKLGNPTPLGLSAFALSTMVSAFYDLTAFGIEVPNVVVGVSLFTGGVVQFAAGMWEFKVGNTFGGTGFSAFGGFWASYGVIFIPGFGIVDAFHGDLIQLHKALAVYCLAWLVFTFIFTLACLRTNMGVLSAFVSLTLTFGFLALYHFNPSTTVFLKLGGIFCMITSSAVWYCLAATLLTPDLSPISLPLWDLSRKEN